MDRTAAMRAALHALDRADEDVARATAAYWEADRARRAAIDARRALQDRVAAAAAADPHASAKAGVVVRGGAYVDLPNGTTIRDRDWQSRTAPLDTV